MDTMTGRVGNMQELIDEGSDPENLLAIQKEMLTAQQEAEGFVALNDSKTPLGKLRQRYDPLTKNQAKRQRRKLHKMYN